MVKKVLIVENDKASIRLFETLLQLHGYNTIVSFDGLDTMKLAKKHRPDLILMDIKLSHASGIELTKKLKESTNLTNIPLIAVTALAAKSDEENIFKAGCDSYLTKPISIGTFLIEIKKYLGFEKFHIIEALKTGYVKIDSEHEQIIRLLNEFSVFQDVDDARSCIKKLTEIFEMTENHIKNEEKILEEHEYDNLNVQKMEHTCMMKKLDDLISTWSIENNNSAFTDALNLIFIEDFFYDDMKFAKYIQ